MKSIEAQRSGAVNGLSIVLPPEARARLGGISESTEWRLRRADPDFPRPVDVTPGLRGYVAAELDAYIALKIAQRDSGAVSPLVARARALGKSGKGGRPRSKRQNAAA
jgi:predicted DNA-binding transcriptional regulator AlpA